MLSSGNLRRRSINVYVCQGKNPNATITTEVNACFSLVQVKKYSKKAHTDIKWHCVSGGIRIKNLILHRQILQVSTVQNKPYTTYNPARSTTKSKVYIFWCGWLVGCLVAGEEKRKSTGGRTVTATGTDWSVLEEPGVEVLHRRDGKWKATARADWQPWHIITILIWMWGIDRGFFCSYCPVAEWVELLATPVYLVV